MNLLRDLRYGVRILRRNRGFAMAAVAVVALGIGATTAVFSVVRGVLLRPLPYRDPERLVLFRADLPGYRRDPLLNPEELFALQDRADLFEAVAVVNLSDGNFTSPDVMAAATAASVSDNFFETLGVPLLLGRSVSSRDVGVQFVNAVTLGYEAWQRHFAGDPGIIGRGIEVNNLPMTVVGVLPRGFELNLGAGVAIPARVDIFFPRMAGYDRDPARARVAVARLKPGVPLETVRAAIDTLALRLPVEHPSRYPDGVLRLSAGTLGSEVTSEVRPALTVLSAAVGIVLLVACANLAMLLLTRVSSRRRELAVRVAIGATRRQVIRQLVAEAAVVGVIGAAAGLMFARWAVDALLLLAPASLPRRDAIVLDAAMAAFAVAVSLASVVAASLAPAWHAATADTSAWLKHETSASRRTVATRGLLVAAQLAVSLMLLVAAGLMGRAFVNMRSVPLGFDPNGTVAMDVALGNARFRFGTFEQTRAARLDFYHQAAQSLQSVPGVERVGFGFPVPLSGVQMIQPYALGPGAPERQAEGIIALAGFLEMLRVPLVAGRYFARSDDDRPVAIVEDRLARELWPGQSAIGQRLLLSRLPSPIAAEVVGVVPHVQTQPFRATALPQIWVTYATRSYGLTVAVRGTGPSLPADVERAIQQLGPGRPVHDVRTLARAVADASADTRFALFVLGAFAVLALVLTAVGVYGSVAYVTAGRTREIAVRRALGARGARIVALVVRESLAWTVAGLAAGLAGAFAVSRYLETLLFGVGANDSITFAGVSVLLAAVAVAATVIPALRAVRVDPMLALRSD